MESYNKTEQDIFHFGIDETGKAYMLEAARWSKFLAIVGLILTGLLTIGQVFLMFGSSAISQQLGTVYGVGYGVGMFFFYMLIILIVLYPSITMLRFANNVRPAIATANTDQFNEALKSLKNTFKFWGIYVIVVLAIYGIMLVFLIIGAAASGL